MIVSRNNRSKINVSNKLDELEAEVAKLEEALLARKAADAFGARAFAFATA